MTEDDKNVHDLKNQLGIILGFSDLLITESAADNSRRRDLEEIRTAATVALDLLDRRNVRHLGDRAVSTSLRQPDSAFTVATPSS